MIAELPGSSFSSSIRFVVALNVAVRLVVVEMSVRTLLSVSTVGSTVISIPLRVNVPAVISVLKPAVSRATAGLITWPR